MRHRSNHKLLLTIHFCLVWLVALPQVAEDSLPVTRARVIPVTDSYKEEDAYVTPFSFLTQVPGNLARIGKSPFEKKNHKPLLIIGGATTVLFFLDQSIINGSESLFQKMGVEQQERSRRLIGIGKVDLLKYPGNINTFFYNLGEPTPSMLIAGGFFLHGKITHNARSRRTASEITESLLTSLITVQTLKRVTGRQSPNRATVPGGKWHWFPSFSDYQNNVTNYIAYPSGHMAIMMSTVTVIAQNYPEKKWIRPLGYSFIGLTALSMLNNKVHWASDFLLGLGIGYLSAKITHLSHRKGNRVKKTTYLN